MAKNIKEVRETIGKDDEPIKVAAYEPRIITIKKMLKVMNYQKEW